MRRDSRRRHGAVSLAILAMAAGATVLTWEPWYLAFPSSIVLAIAWCIWLEQDPAA